jgi:hypothetical protein
MYYMYIFSIYKRIIVNCYFVSSEQPHYCSEMSGRYRSDQHFILMYGLLKCYIEVWMYGYIAEIFCWCMDVWISKWDFILMCGCMDNWTYILYWCMVIGCMYTWLMDVLIYVGMDVVMTNLYETFYSMF